MFVGKPISDYRDYLKRVIAASDRGFNLTGHPEHKWMNKAYRDALRALNKFKSSKIIPFVTPTGVCAAFQQAWLDVEVLPRELTDVVMECQPPANGGRPFDDALSGQSLHDAIINAKNVGLRLLRYIKPENLLFVFSETVEGLQLALGAFPFSPPPPYPPCEFNPYCDGQKCTCEDKYDTEPRAIILCNVKNTQGLKDFPRRKEHEGQPQKDRCEITWSELQELEKRFGERR